jgi:transcriptional regulator with XRE-family HTH domain
VLLKRPSARSHHMKTKTTKVIRQARGQPAEPASGRGKPAQPLRRGKKLTVEQDPAHISNAESPQQLERSIGQRVKALRHNANLTVSELSRRAGISSGMLSKIETGSTSPSLATLHSLSKALSVPVTSLFKLFEEQRDASFVPAGHGIVTERRGTRAGHQYQLLGHILTRSIIFEPYLITLTDRSDVFPIFQHTGVEYLYMLQGEVDYRHGSKIYKMRPGDSLLFDSDVPHGPEVLHKLPALYLSIIVSLPDSD